MFFQMGPLRYLRTVSKMMADDALARAPQVSAPALVVRGTRDGLVPEASARRLAAALANGAFVSVAGAAHTPHYNNAPHFTHLALSFWEDWNRAKQPEAALEAAAVERGA
jgi:pimeloyl-ACP methyl ester carboxylesterase